MSRQSFAGGLARTWGRALRGFRAGRQASCAGAQPLWPQARKPVAHRDRWRGPRRGSDV